MECYVRTQLRTNTVNLYDAFVIKNMKDVFKGRSVSSISVKDWISFSVLRRKKVNMCLHDVHSSQLVWLNVCLVLDKLRRDKASIDNLNASRWRSYGDLMNSLNVLLQLHPCGHLVSGLESAFKCNYYFRRFHFIANNLNFVVNILLFCSLGGLDFLLQRMRHYVAKLRYCRQFHLPNQISGTNSPSFQPATAQRV